ncbi:MAG: hypothetical protein NXI30_04480 [bacterium]|nr:hypothetical protein [bacterium]
MTFVDENQRKAFHAFFQTPEGAWLLEALIVGNHVLDALPDSRIENEMARPVTEFERGVCEGRRRLVLEMLDVFQLGVQDAYGVINRVERMAQGEASEEGYADS